MEQINAVINCGIVPHLVNILRTGDFRAQKEAAWAITNITSGGAIEHMVYLCQNGGIPAMCEMLSCRDWRTTLTVLDGLDNILKGAQEVGQQEKVAIAIEECGGVDKIEQLQSHDNNTVYTKAYMLIDQFFSDEGGADGDENLLPETTESGEFQLSVNTSVPQGGFNL